MKIKNYILNNTEINIPDRHWNYLVVLDACRYDLFKECGFQNVKKAISPSTWTLDWICKTFPDYYNDIIYISANPFINSKTKTSEKEKYSFNNVMSYKAKDHFYKVVDAWDHNWKYGTVHPSFVNKCFHKALLRHIMNRHSPDVFGDRILFHQAGC